MRIVLSIVSALCVFAADIAVRREGPAFRVSGARSEAEIAVYVGEGDVPPVLGTFSRDGADFLFHPRFPLAKTVHSRVVVGGRLFPFPAEKQELHRTTIVERVYPTGAEIPANQLKFYIQFSARMLPGEAWDHLRLLDANGKTVELAFLEIDQELWDPEGRRLTVLFDPGRIKRGVLPRDQVGAALEAGKKYTLEIDAAWRDDRRVPLREPYRKTFKVVDEDRSAIDTARWQVAVPPAGSRQPLVIRFGEPLDAALALRLLSIPAVPGTAQLANEEREWHYTPSAPWPASKLEVLIDTALEDLAGNKVGRPFDVDTFDRITTRTGRGHVRIGFQPLPAAR